MLVELKKKEREHSSPAYHNTSQPCSHTRSPKILSPLLRYATMCYTRPHIDRLETQLVMLRTPSAFTYAVTGSGSARGCWSRPRGCGRELDMDRWIARAQRHAFGAEPDAPVAARRGAQGLDLVARRQLLAVKHRGHLVGHRRWCGRRGCRAWRRPAARGTLNLDAEALGRPRLALAGRALGGGRGCRRGRGRGRSRGRVRQPSRTPDRLALAGARGGCRAGDGRGAGGRAAGGGLSPSGRPPSYC